MKNLFFCGSLLATLIFFTTTKTYAKEVCDTIEDCRTLQTKVEARLVILLASLTPELGDLAKDENGKPVSMIYESAKKYCNDRGTRLPTARELALIAQSLGAKGILQTKSEGATPISKDKYEGRDSDVEFYYSSYGYKGPTKDFGGYTVWSSTFAGALRTSTSYNFTFYTFNSRVGNFDNFEDGYNTSHVFVRCVK